MKPAYPSRDNEFIAWYPCALKPASEPVWSPTPSTYYVHIPFCEAICDYCGFSVAKLKNSHVDEYIDHVILEFQMYADAGLLANRSFEVGAFGGGTPSTLTPEQFHRIASRLHGVLNVSQHAEITVEANPLSLTAEKLESYRSVGVNRLSLGVQSFNEKALHTIGRPHRLQDIERSIKLLQRSKIDNFSIDLMYGIPGQTTDELVCDLRKAVETGATHLSCFRLEIIPFTRLSLRRGAGLLPAGPAASEERAIEAAVADTLRQLGFERYGAFNFAKPGYESRHNALIFSPPQRDFFGFGNSAFSFVGNLSYCNFTSIEDYCREIDGGRFPVSHARRATTLEMMSRFFVLGLKMDGVRRSDFVAAHGMEPEVVFGEVIGKLIDYGLLKAVADTFSLTEEGRHYVNNVCKEFYVLENIGHSQHGFSFQPTIGLRDIEFFRRKASGTGKPRSEEVR
jgi:oxygen-independent coproporphyrinogen-3 oxidase